MKAKDENHKAELKAKDLEMKKIKEVIPAVAVPTRHGRSSCTSIETIVDEDAIALKVSKLVVKCLEKKIPVVIEPIEILAESESRLHAEEVKHAVTAKELEMLKAQHIFVASSAVNEAKFLQLEQSSKDQLTREDKHMAEKSAIMDKLFVLLGNK